MVGGNAIFTKKCQQNVKNGINSVFDIDFMGDLIYNKITIEMQSFEKVDLAFLLEGKEIYYINHLQRQFLTKSSAKIMYDCMVRL